MTALIFVVIALALVFQHYSADLPSVDQLATYDPPVVTRLYANDGKLLAEYAKEKRIFVPLSAIPKHVQQAFISAEDQNFYQHKGVDLFGIVRAVKENIVNYGSGKSMVGGSTITQQVVKNFLLTSEKSLERKVKEAILAYRISSVYSKEKILELYLNEIYLGQGTYGVAAASLNYFNKSLDALTTEESALLAAMPKAPAYYDPAKNYQPALERRNYVISRMKEDGYINDAEAQRASSTAIILRERDKTETAHADYFAEEVRRRLSEQYGSDILYKGGLFVKTTVDPLLQSYADNALRYALTLYDRRHGFRGPLGHSAIEGGWEKHLALFQQTQHIPLFDKQTIGVVLSLSSAEVELGLLSGARTTISAADAAWARRYVGRVKIDGKTQTIAGVLKQGDVLLLEPKTENPTAYRIAQIPEVNGAMIVMDPHTGRVLALSGGYAYGGPDQFNRATQAKRQPGSAYKPFVYLTALENGFNPTSIIVDGPIELSQGAGLPLWRPKNYEGKFLGPTTLRRGLEKSRNTMTVRLAVILGIKRIKRMAVRLGIYDHDVAADFSMVLGAKETTLLKLVNAYSMLVNGGRRVDASLIERIDNRNGVTLFRRDARDCKECEFTASPIETQAAFASENVEAQVSPETQPPSKPGDVSLNTATPPTIADDREQVLDPRIAYQMVSILEGVVQRGTATAARILNRPLGGKTGTTNESRDTWFIGFSPDLVVGTYIGYDTPRTMGQKETGSRVALPAFIHFMQHALKDTPATDFRIPAGIQQVSINGATGQPLYYGEENSAVPIIKEAFVVGGEIFKPKSELDAQALDPETDTKNIINVEQPEELLEAPFNPHDPIPSEGFEGDSSYSTRPSPAEGFDPQSPPPRIDRTDPAQTGTGGLY